MLLSRISQTSRAQPFCTGKERCVLSKMTKITQIDDRSATSAWSPIREYADVIAIGAKDSGGAGFDETGGELEIYDLQLSHSDLGPKLLGSVKTESRFASLAWTPSTAGGVYPLGLLAGGMENGKIHVWNPQAVMEGTDSLVASFTQHASGPVKALQFNGLSPLQLATGGSDGKVVVFHLDQLPTGNPLVPCETKQQSAQITAVAWNTQVAHIVASAAADGTVAVWDLKGRKAWCELRAETAGMAVADLAWNPTEGLHLLTASADDRNPVIKLWDLRSSTSMPLTSLKGHQQGILSMAWCPHDDHLLLTCGKDNRTILWDLVNLQPVADLPNDSPTETTHPAAGNEDTFGAGGLASSQQRRYEVHWSPFKRGVASTCSLDRKVQAHSILGLSSKAGRPPKWMRRASSVSCGFGGSLVSCGAKDRLVRLRSHAEQPDLVQLSNDFEATIAATQVSDYCQAMAAQATTPGEAQLWAFMQVIFETDARQQLLDTLGYDPDAIAQAAVSFAEEPTMNGTGSLSLEDKVPARMSKSTEDMVKKALLVGNFEVAVECCFKTGNLADGLVLASCGGEELWAKTQQRYFEEQSANRSFLKTVNAVIQNQLAEFVRNSEPENWHETLAILCTYGRSDEFPSLCVALGDLLENAKNTQSASLCYMCALSLEGAVRFWRIQLHEANMKKGGVDIAAAHDFVVKVSIFLLAVGESITLEPEDSEVFSLYASRLAEQGLLAAAAKYSKGDSKESRILRDRLYRSKATGECLAAMGNTPPDFPFDYTDIHPSRGPTIDRAAQEAERHAAAAQQAAYEAEREEFQRQQQERQAAEVLSYNQGMLAPATVTDSNALPPGWMALEDPTSGQYYYFDQTTGETTWDRPLMPVGAPESVAAPQPVPAHELQQTSSRSVTPNTKRLADKYGDGFVTSASHPELASQYGNVGTGNPYGTTSRPGTASVSSNQATTPSKSYIPDDGHPPELQADYVPIKECVTSLIGALKQAGLSAVDKRLILEAEKATAIMVGRLALHEISDDIGQQLLTMCGYLNAYEFETATAVMTALVNSDWREHKDWLKGTKSLLQLASKKYGTHSR